MQEIQTNEMKYEEHHLETLAEVLKVVNEDNVGGFLTDSAHWPALDIQLRAPELKGKIELKNRGVFHWIDDGQTEIKATIEIIPPPEKP